MRSAKRPLPALAVALATILAIVVSATSLRAAEILQESLRIPALMDGARVELDALVMPPDDPRPHPLALINHGSPRDSNDRSTMSPFGMSAQAQAFSRRGFVATPPLEEDGDALFSARGAAIWSPIVDRFLLAHGLMADAAAASGSKRISAPGGLDARGQQAFATYLESGPNKAFATGEGGHFGWASGRLSSEEAKRAALYFCVNGGASNCAIVNLNDDSVH